MHVCVTCTHASHTFMCLSFYMRVSFTDQSERGEFGPRDLFAHIPNTTVTVSVYNTMNRLSMRHFLCVVGGR